MGRIGTEVARRGIAFGMRVLAYDPYLSHSRAKALQVAIFQENCLQGLYQPQFAQFWAKNMLKWVDKQDVSLTGNMSITDIAALAGVGEIGNHTKSAGKGSKTVANDTNA